tara:strand:+ start:360 stop:1100 length:741 start_codon:yes stop_codon:yes gene_type:complete
MNRYLAFVSYVGTAYCGFQIQTKELTVQACLDDALSTVLRQPIKIKASSRTDTGVHAHSNAFHFDCLLELDKMYLKRLNGYLPQDVCVLSFQKVNADFHSRFDALEREYIYLMHYGKKPFLELRSWQYFGGKFDLNKANQALKVLLTYQDFAAFSKSNTQVKTTLCDIREALWLDEGNGCFKFKICANRFLRGMVRAIVATSINVGVGKLDLNDFESIILSKESSRADFSAPAFGLYLNSVKYALT